MKQGKTRNVKNRMSNTLYVNSQAPQDILMKESKLEHKNKRTLSNF